jgi:hypothetical protein
MHYTKRNGRINIIKWTKLAVFRNIEDVGMYYTIIPSINEP